MENASKALLIAGAVLIVILIIGVGMAIFTSAQGNIDSAMSSLSSDQIKQFNSKFEMYEGSKKGSQIRQLLSDVATNNQNYTAGAEGYVQINSANYGTAQLSATATGRQAYNPSTTYRVTIQYGTTGLVNNITITP